MFQWTVMAILLQHKRFRLVLDVQLLYRLVADRAPVFGLTPMLIALLPLTSASALWKLNIFGFAQLPDCLSIATMLV